MSSAPHLPPREVKAERKLKKFAAFVFLVVLLSFASGVAAAAVAVTWLLPPFPAARSIFTFFQNQPENTADTFLNSVEQIAAQDRVVQVYDKRKALSSGFYEKSGWYGEAVVFTVDGWAVLFSPTLTPAQLPFLQVVDARGRVRSVERLVNEPATGLVYLNIEGEGFPVFSLANGNFSALSPLWFLKAPDFFLADPVFSFPITKETSRLITLLQPQIPHAPAGAVVVNEKGELLGLVDKNKALISGSELNRQLRFLQKNGILGIKDFFVTGYVVEGAQTDERGATARHYGFVITDANKFKNVLKAQDIIVQIQQKDFSPFSARDDILALPDEFTVTVLRQGKKIEIKVNKM